MCIIATPTKCRGTQLLVCQTSASNQNDQSLRWMIIDCNLTSPGNFTGIVGSTICDHDYNSNQGCNIVDPSIASFGPVFDQKGGGVFVMKWDSDSMDVWFFYRSAIPDDILNGLPDPSTWRTPSASLSSLRCPIDSYFWDHVLIFGQ